MDHVTRPSRRAAALLPHLLLCLLLASGVVPATTPAGAAPSEAAPSEGAPSDGTPSDAVAVDHRQQPPWLQRLNSHRTSSGLTAVTEDPDRSGAIVEAVTYMAQRGQTSHQLPADAGARAQEAAARSNLSQDAPDTTPVQVVDRWMTDPGHLRNMLNPDLALTGFGQATGGGSIFSGLWTIPREGDPRPDLAYPYAFPGDGATIDLPPYDGFALPDPLTHCPGYSAPTGFPLMLQLADPFAPTRDIGGTALVDAAGAAVPHCALVGEEYRNPDSGSQQLFREILTNSVSLIPRQPLPPGTYRATVAVDGRDITWAFTIGADGGGEGGGSGGDVVDPVTEELSAATPSLLSRDVSAARFGDGTAVHAVLASAERFPDALAGTALTLEGPMLLTPQAGLDPQVAEELRRVLPPGGTVYLLGGTAALSPAVEDAVAGLGFTPVRLQGATRILTAVAVAEEVVARYGADAAVVARAGAGGSADETAAWADSVAVGAHTAATGTPVLLTDTAALSADVAAALDRLGITRTVVVGGRAAVSDEVMAALPDPQRIAGASRTATALAVAQQLVGGAGVVLIDGFAPDGWAGGLVGAGLAADRGWSVLLARSGQVPDDTAAGLDGCASTVAVVGSDALAQSLRSPLAALVDPAC